MTAATLTLAEFLLARIAEDEAVANAADRAEISTVQHEHMARWDPARVLAECEAKRRIVNLLVLDAGHPRELDHVARDEEDAATGVLQLLALPYADHPDYDEAWRP